MVGQTETTTYTDPVTGYTLTSDARAYADASVALVKANQYLTEMGNLIALQERLMFDAEAAGYPLPSSLLTLYAEALGEQDAATQHKATLQTYVDRYRYMVFGSGVQGLGALGILPLLAVAIAVGIAAVAAALGYFLVRSYDLAAARVQLAQHVADYQTWLGEQVASGTMDPHTAETLSGQAGQLAADVAAEGGGFLDFLKGPLGLVVVAAVVFMAISSTRR